MRVLLGICLPWSGELDPRVEKSIDSLRGDHDLLILRDLPSDLNHGDRIWRISRCRERFRQYMLQHPEYDALLFIDSDIIFPVDTLEVLKAEDGDVVNHAYFGEVSIGKRREMPSEIDFPTIELRNGKIVVLSGLGCTLIKRKVLEKCDFVARVDPWESLWGEDVWFFRQVHDHKFKVTLVEGKLDLVHISKTVNKDSFWKQLKDNPDEFRRWGRYDEGRDKS